MKTLGAKVGTLGIGHLAVAGISAVASDRLQAGFLGRGTLMGGVVKVVEGIVINYAVADSSYGKAIALGFGVNGIMDIANSFLGGTAFGSSTSTVQMI